MKVVYLFFIFVWNFLFCSFVMASIGQQCIVLGASWSSIVTDKFQFQVLGSENVSEELRNRAINVFQLLKMNEPEKIQIKRMSASLRKCVGDQNCMATGNAVFVDEEWLLSLSEDEQKFVLAHEAMHIKNKDTAKKIGAYLAIFVVFCVGIAHFKNKGYGGVIGMSALGVVELAALAAYHRYQEARADADAAHVVPTAFQTINDTDIPRDQSWLQKTCTWLCSWFDEYNTDRFKKFQ